MVKALSTFAFIYLVSSTLFAQVQCPPNQHWDPEMNMCMPDGGPVECPANMHWSAEEDQCVPDNCKAGEVYDIHQQKCVPQGQCPADQEWDNSMNMCMPKGNTTLSLHGTQYLIGLSGEGPRGRTAFSAPNMFMLTFQKRISKCDTIKVTWMGTTDKWTIPKRGTPELLQTGEANQDAVPYIDAQHPHTSPVMGLTVAEVHCFGKEGKDTFTISFAPRGEATAGPQAFMHRESAEGNPNAPLGHHLQDVFHIMSTVIAGKLEKGKWIIEGSVFSGKEPSPSEVDLKMGKIDSSGTRVEYKVNKNIKVGGSVASVLENHRVPVGATPEPPARSTLIAAWVNTSNTFKSGAALSTSAIYGQGTEESKTLHSFLQEATLKFGKLQKNHVFSRFEILQRTPEQLEIEVVGDSRNPEWVKALTVGYERKIKTTKNADFYTGGSYTKSYVPTQFQAAYGGGSLNSGEIHLRIVFNKSWKLGK